MSIFFLVTRGSIDHTNYYFFYPVLYGEGCIVIVLPFVRLLVRSYFRIVNVLVKTSPLVYIAVTIKKYIQL